MNDRRRALLGWLSALALLAFLFGSALSARAAPDATVVYINEFHYDNAGQDTGEFIEIAGPATTNLTGWKLVLYNGSDGKQYNTRELLGTIPDQSNGYGTIDFVYPSNGIQNGAPDGIALINPSNAVVQFLSYEGVFVASDGPAAGLSSTDVGVEEVGTTPTGYSLQLQGTGCSYESFTWTGPAPASPGNINSGQTIPPSCVAAVTLAAFDAAQQSDGTTLVTWQTVSEVEALGFNVWRSAEASAPAERLNASLIPAAAVGSGQGASYDFTDGSANGTAHYYWLEDMSLDGSTTLHGPILAQPQVPTAVTTSALSATSATRWPTLLGALAALIAGAGLLTRRR